jgi:hypothetical protein
MACTATTRRLLAMRLISWLVISLALVGCESDPPPSETTAQATSISPPDVNMVTDDSLTPVDIGAVVVGSIITVPAYQELQLAAVVMRNGVFSAEDSFVSCVVSSLDRKQPCRLVAVSPQGLLRSGATDTLIRCNGRTLRFAGQQWPMVSRNGPFTLIAGAPYAEIGDIVYGGPGPSYSSDVHHPDNVAFSIHLYARLVALAADDPRMSTLHGTGAQTMNRELDVKTLAEVVAPDPTSTGHGKSSF